MFGVLVARAHDSPTTDDRADPVGDSGDVHVVGHLDRDCVVVRSELEKGTGDVGGEQCERGAVGQLAVGHLDNAGDGELPDPEFAGNRDGVADRDVGDLRGTVVQHHLGLGGGRRALADETVGAQLRNGREVRTHRTLGESEPYHWASILSQDDRRFALQSWLDRCHPVDTRDDPDEAVGYELADLLERSVLGDRAFDDEVSSFAPGTGLLGEPGAHALQE